MKLLYTLLFVFLATLCYAQQEQAKQKRQNVYFFKNDGRPVTEQDSADFVRFVIEPDSGSMLYNVQEYYLNNNRRFIGQSSQIDPVTLEEQGVSFYPDGNKKLVTHYRHGQAYGPTYQYYPNGKLYIVKEYITNKQNVKGRGGTGKLDSTITAVYDSTGKAIADNGNGYYIRYDNDFKTIDEEGPLKNAKPNGHWKGKEKARNAVFEEQYAEGNLIAGVAIDSTGEKTAYQKRFIMPEFPGGVAAYGQFLGRNLRYPGQARENNIQGTVVLNFIVKSDGAVTDIKVINSVSKTLDDEAVRVMKATPKWVPGVAYGKASRFRYTVPISFTLRYNGN